LELEFSSQAAATKPGAVMAGRTVREVYLGTSVRGVPT